MTQSKLNTQLEELKLLVREYDPKNSDWGFRASIMHELIHNIELEIERERIQKLSDVIKTILTGERNARVSCDCCKGSKGRRSP